MLIDWSQMITAEDKAAVVVPQRVTPLQARNALRAAGLMPAVTAWLATADDALVDAWEYALAIERDSAFIAAAAAALGLSDAQVDALFVAAAGL